MSGTHTHRGIIPDFRDHPVVHVGKTSRLQAQLKVQGDEAKARTAYDNFPANLSAEYVWRV